MGSPLGPMLGKAFVALFEKNWSQNGASYFKPHYYRRYVDDIFFLFTSANHLEALQPQTKLKKSLKNILNCSKLQIVFKNKSALGNKFYFKDQIPKDLISGVVYKFQCGLYNESYFGECVRHLHVRIGEHIGISTFTKKQVKPENSSLANH